MSTRRYGLWLLVAIAVLAAAAFAGRSFFKRPPVGSNTATAPGATPATSAETAVELAASDVARVAYADMGASLNLTGNLKAVNSAIVKAKVAAEVKSLQVREGERVQAGQLLGVLDSTEYDWRLKQAEEQALAAQAQLEIAQRTLDNNKALVNQGFISRNALDTASSSMAGASASLQAARAAAEISRKAVRDTRITAPISGLVAQRFVQPGERVALDARIVEIVDLAKLELEASVPPDEVVSLRVGQMAAVRVDGLAQPVPARVVRINPSAQAGTRSLLAYLALNPASDAAGSLRQGLFARAQVELQRKRALVVPATAVRYDQAQPYVLLLQAGQAQQRRVSTGLQGTAGGPSTSTGNTTPGADETVLEVTSGLAEGDVVLRGSVGALRAGTRLVLKGAPAAAAPAALMPAAAAPAAPAASR